MADISKIIGERIKQLRLKANLSQEQLAELADLHVTYISRVERAVVSPTITVYQNIAKGLGVSLSHLFFIPDATHQIDPELQMQIIKIVDTIIEVEKSKGIMLTDALLSFLEQIDLK